MPDESTENAREGSFAHGIAERALVQGSDAKDFIGVTDGEFTVDEDMAADIDVYLDIVRHYEMLADDSFVEHRVHFNDDCWGTADYVAIAGQTLHVFDFKYGRARVEASMNEQLLIYGAALRRVAPSAEFERQLTDVEFHIVQPRVEPSFDEEHAVRGRHQTWRVHARWLDDWAAKKLEPAIQATQVSAARLVPGDHCTYCPAKATCPALADTALQAAQEVFPSGDIDSPVVPPQPYTLNDERLRAVLDAAPLVRKWLDSVEAFALQQARDGRTPDGFKLVSRIGNRKWKDEHEARAALRALGIKPTTETTISPAQAQKALGGKQHKPFIDGLCNRPVTGEKLVPVSDRRPALPGADVFLEGQ